MRASRYSAYVHWMRVALPAAALALLVLLALWPRFFGLDSDLIAPAELTPDVVLGEPMTMEGARYVGSTAEEEMGYALEASRATLDPAKPDEIVIDGLEGRVDREDGDVAVSAGSGVYDRERGALRLEDGVTVRSEDGYAIDTESAEIDIEAGSVEGDRPVEGAGPLGSIRADRFRVGEEGGRLEFEGGVRVVLPERATGEPTPEQAPEGAEETEP